MSHNWEQKSALEAIAEAENFLELTISSLVNTNASENLQLETKVCMMPCGSFKL